MEVGWRARDCVRVGSAARDRGIAVPNPAKARAQAVVVRQRGLESEMCPAAVTC